MTVTINTGAKQRAVTANDDTTSYVAQRRGAMWTLTYQDHYVGSYKATELKDAVERFEEARFKAGALPRRSFAYTENMPWTDARDRKNIVTGVHVISYEAEIFAVTEHAVFYRTTAVTGESGQPAEAARRCSTGGQACTWMPFADIFKTRSFRWIDPA